MDRTVSYKREMKHNYLMIEGEVSEESQYETKMLISNPIEGLLRFRMKKVDTQCYFCYEITSRQPLSRLLENRSIQAAEIRQMIIDIAHTLTALEEYLLKEEQILLEPEFIYVEPDLFGVELCLLPGQKGNFPEEMSKLLEYLLGKVDYQDKNAVVMVYGLYRESLKENYGMEDLLRLLMKAETGEEETKEEETKKEPTKEVLLGEEIPVRIVPIEKEAKTKKRDRGNSVWHDIGMGVAILAGSQVIMWLLTGMEGSRRYGVGLAVIELALLGARLLLKKRPKVPKSIPRSPEKQKKHSMEEDSWQMVFEEDNLDERSVTVQNSSQEAAEGNTMLLLDLDEKRPVRKLVGLEVDIPDILISYYPFIIGKQENLVDFILEKDPVSRLHLRLDEQEGNYRITDLNSTNGTAVNGKLLENNETFGLKPGDEVEIANYKFKFM